MRSSPPAWLCLPLGPEDGPSPTLLLTLSIPQKCLESQSGLPTGNARVQDKCVLFALSVLTPGGGQAAHRRSGQKRGERPCCCCFKPRKYFLVSLWAGPAEPRNEKHASWSPAPLQSDWRKFNPVCGTLTAPVLEIPPPWFAGLCVLLHLPPLQLFLPSLFCSLSSTCPLNVAVSSRSTLDPLQSAPSPWAIFTTQLQEPPSASPAPSGLRTPFTPQLPAPLWT